MTMSMTHGGGAEHQHSEDPDSNQENPHFVDVRRDDDRHVHGRQAGGSSTRSNSSCCRSSCSRNTLRKRMLTTRMRAVTYLLAMVQPRIDDGDLTLMLGVCFVDDRA